MTESKSREERKKVEDNMRTKKKNGLSKVYYWIIGILFLILLLLVVYIFANSGDNVDLGSEDETTSLVQEVETDNGADTSTDQSEETESTVEPEATEEDPAEEPEVAAEEPKETVEGEVNVNENAPLDTGHTVDYNSGSADRIAIKEKVMEATGLGNDLIENWIGNNGPGRVTADVYSPDKSKVYRVYLQYGDGDWHVTNYESLNSVPEN